VVKGRAVSEHCKQIWKGMEIQVKEEAKEWLQRSYVGRLNKFCNIEDIKESFILNDLNFIRLRYLGDNVMLLTAKGEQSIEKAIIDNQERLSNTFESLLAWTNQTSIGYRRAWVRCRGIPIYLWGWECFEKVSAAIDTLISIDKATEEWDEIEYARLNVRLPIETIATKGFQMKINGKIYQISFEEESTLFTIPKCSCESWEKLEEDHSYSQSCIGDDPQQSSDSECGSINEYIRSQSNMVGRAIFSSEVVPVGEDLPEGLDCTHHQSSDWLGAATHHKIGKQS